MTTKRNQIDAEELLTPGEAAAELGVAVRSLARIADRGDIGSVKLPSGHRRYRREDIEALTAGARPGNDDREVAS